MAKSPPQKRYSVRFEPDGVGIIVEPGANLLETAIAAGVHINASCGGSGVCGTCKVLIKKGEVQSEITELLRIVSPRVQNVNMLSATFLRKKPGALLYFSKLLWSQIESVIHSRSQRGRP